MNKKIQQEQNEAAGINRELRLTDGSTAIASVSVRQYSRTPNQQYGFLQFKSQGKTVTKYVGRITADSKTECLKLGWAIVREKKVAESYGWSWINAKN